ncbi:hypothetical protein EWM64_g1681 [Hericium alpestre]|uniref:Methyltransferase domain-containing protein n=1 Tax=Hericium alpestre TaxID=135208 RepID=A0A4Z0A8T0_9AGAM|nr:hypothetical protein EWM64_g1681 [Hericium alpestre]
MRDNYGEHGVENYYTKVGSTYRNPHYPGVRRCLFSWFTSWWTEEYSKLDEKRQITVFDMACGSGEVTIALAEWWHASSIPPSNERPSLPQRKTQLATPSNFDPNTSRPHVMAADPYTAEAFRARLSASCASLSFRDIAEGALPETRFRLPLVGMIPEDLPPEVSDSSEVAEMIICSFALHLIDNPSELFALLWELSTKFRWLVILAPHKKPEIKGGWGWMKWDVDKWQGGDMGSSEGEYLFDR